MVMFFFDHPKVHGLFNVGTGKARSWNDLARALFAALDKKPCIDYIEMPKYLRPKYQYFTQAEMGKIKEAGYAGTGTDLEEAIKDYTTYLNNENHL